MIDECFAIEGGSRNSMYCKYTPNERKVEFLVLEYASFYKGNELPCSKLSRYKIKISLFSMQASEYELIYPDTLHYRDYSLQS